MASRNSVYNMDLSAARTTTGPGATQFSPIAIGAFIGVIVSAVSGTTPAVVAKVQWSPDGGTTWVDLDATNAVTGSLTGVGQGIIKVYPNLPVVAAGAANSPLPTVWRLFYTISGTTPSVTLASWVSYILG